MRGDREFTTIHPPKGKKPGKICIEPPKEPDHTIYQGKRPTPLPKTAKGGKKG